MAEAKFKVGDYVATKEVTGKIEYVKVLIGEGEAQFQRRFYPSQVGLPETVSTARQVGIVYEVGGWGGVEYRFQRADGEKVRGIPEDWLEPASAKDIKAYEKSAIEGMNPQAIIEREAAEGHGGEDDPQDDE